VTKVNIKNCNKERKIKTQLTSKIIKNLPLERIGEENVNSYGSTFKIVEYNNAHDIIVQFYDGYKRKANYHRFSKGEVSNPYDRTVCGVGYFGEGNYIGIFKGKHHKWVNMLHRCYNEKIYEKCPSYKGCTVCEEWHNFQVFAKWYDENYYEIDGQIMELDKDILVKGNKIYSPETCVFVPHNINVLFVKSNGKRGEFPIGVSLHKKSNTYIASCKNKSTKKVTIGYYPTIELAFNTYKKYKEAVIKEVADEYKDKIPQKLYSAMYKYEVEITD